MVPQSERWWTTFLNMHGMPVPHHWKIDAKHSKHGVGAPPGERFTAPTTDDSSENEMQASTTRSRHETPTRHEVVNEEPAKVCPTDTTSGSVGDTAEQQHVAME